MYIIYYVYIHDMTPSESFLLSKNGSLKLKQLVLITSLLLEYIIRTHTYIYIYIYIYMYMLYIYIIIYIIIHICYIYYNINIY